MFRVINYDLNIIVFMFVGCGLFCVVFYCIYWLGVGGRAGVGEGTIRILAFSYFFRLGCFSFLGVGVSVSVMC